LGLLASFTGTIQASFAQASYAQSASGADYEALMKASFTLMAFDMMEQRCLAKGGFSATETTAIDAWKKTNAIPAMRIQMQKLRADPTQDSQLRQAVASIAGALDKNPANPCPLVLRLIDAPDAQFATLIPGLASAKLGTSAKSPAAKTTGVAPSGGVSANRPSAVSQQIDSFGFDTRMIMGMGGFLTTDIYPIVLFRDGSALKKITALSAKSSLADLQRNSPDDWTKWRRNGGKIELQGSKGWDPIAFPKTYASLPPSFRLDGLFRRLSGTGNIASGGDQSASFVRDYRFWADGTVLRGGTAGAAASSGSGTTVVSTAQPDARGKYRIEGLMLNITYDDGSSESRILVADPNDPKTAIWLDGAGYVRRQR
jgi:hypothetical protein